MAVGRQSQTVSHQLNDGNIIAMMHQLGSVPKSAASARKAIREALPILRDQAIANAKLIDDPKTKKKNIYKNIKTQVRKTRKKTNVRFRLGIDKKREFWAMHKRRIQVVAGVRKKTPNPFYGTLQKGATPYWSFVELGTRHSKPKPFMLPALNQKGRATTNKFNQIFLREIEQKVRDARARRAARASSSSGGGTTP